MTSEMAVFRVLIVEDEMLIAIEIEDALRAFGYDVVGPTGKLETALQLATDEMIDAAILDVTIRGGQVFPVAEKLLERGIPFILASGYGGWALPDGMRDLPRLIKPFTSEALNAEIIALRKEYDRRKTTV